MKRICRVYAHTRQAYYRHREREYWKSRYQKWLIEVVKVIRQRLPHTGGKNLWRLVQRFQRMLKICPVGRDKLARILRENGLKVRWVKRHNVRTTYSGHRYAVQPNLIRELSVTGPNQLWVADITYIDVDGCHAFLFLITDKFSRKIVGYHLATSMHADGAIEALKKALFENGYPAGVIHHSDRGVQYCCHDFIDEIRK